MSLEQQLSAVNKQINEIDQQIYHLKTKKRQLLEDSQLLKDRLDIANQETSLLPDYKQENFSWSQSLQECAKKHWDITSFRDLQVPIMNAALDRKRDVFVVLPTGGGKSLCYQLPAILESGFTLVISPLVSLIKDQTFHLNDANVPAAYLTASSSKEYVKDVLMSMSKPASTGGPPFKLLYVTPEKIANSKRFMAKLSDAYDSRVLDRIVIDEAHCCSQQGHDFRPDYKKLNVLRSVFPNTPIMALTATCPWNVMKDVMRILGMKQPQHYDGTLVYSAPLYRPNLVYKVLPKPDTQEKQMHHMADWIMTNYPESSGIIYCLTKKETSEIASALGGGRHGFISCGIYHADMSDEEKEETHRKWRQNEIQVIVATIAFGMGINHLQTRFVIHHTLSKSVEGYYQESGRAGRDGKKAECILYYRGQDASRLSTMVVDEVQGRDNLNAIVRYAQEYTTCRKIFFEKYFFLESGDLQFQGQDNNIDDSGAHLVNQTTPDIPCGICDNCVRDRSTIVEYDISTETVTLVTILRALQRLSKRVTLLQLINIWKGRSLKAHHLTHLKENSNICVPVDSKFSDTDLESIINYLVAEDYLADDYHFTPYTTYAYIVEGPRASQFIMADDSGDLDITLEFIRQKQDEQVSKKRKQSGQATSRNKMNKRQGNSPSNAIDLE